MQIGVIGLGYVGLPLAVEFGKKYPVIGFDVNQKRVSSLLKGIDETRELRKEDLDNAVLLSITADEKDLEKVNFFIVTVPTPVDNANNPDLTIVRKATELIGKYLKQGDIVVYESTVYPGVTEEFCVPILEEVSKLKFNIGFFCGYSPERINPGDHTHTLTKIMKVTSGSTPETADLVDSVYSSIIAAGTYKASSIKVAEAAKVIENTQRDINIAFVNELAKIFNLMGINTYEVLAAARTKWNFLSFKPGLVGGHCIGVDPYYLAHKAQSYGYHPELILGGRRINDGMSKYVAAEIIKGIICTGHSIKGEKILVMGITFKENCPDIRNSKVADLVNELRSYSVGVDIYDPWADAETVAHEYGFRLADSFDVKQNQYKAIVLAVAHQEFNNIDWVNTRTLVPFIYDLKGVLPETIADKSL